MGLSTAGPRRAPGGSVEEPRLMGAPRAECPAMDNPRTCLPRAVLRARRPTESPNDIATTSRESSLRTTASSTRHRRSRNLAIPLVNFSDTRLGLLRILASDDPYRHSTFRIGRRGCIQKHAPAIAPGWPRQLHPREIHRRKTRHDQIRGLSTHRVAFPTEETRYSRVRDLSGRVGKIELPPPEGGDKQR